MSHVSLAKIIDGFQAKATYIFCRDEISQKLKSSPKAISLALSRLIAKKRIVRLYPGLFLIIPLEYQNAGAPPPVWYIEPLMEYLGLTYYVGLLTASSLHGAAHQQPGVFQVITTKQIKQLHIGRAVLKFYYKKQAAEIPVLKMKSETGYFNVSTPEITAFDVIKYIKASGSLDNAATCLAELAHKINPVTLATVASNYDLATVQRTGYLLERFGEVKVTDHLFMWLSQHPLRYMPLRQKMAMKSCPRDPRWHLIINETVEIDS